MKHLLFRSLIPIWLHEKTPLNFVGAVKKTVMIGTLASGIAAANSAVAEPVSAPVMIGVAITEIPAAVVSPVIAVSSLALITEAICTGDTSHSCTEASKQAGQDLLDYVRGKKNGFKAAERAFKRVFGL